MTLRSSRKLFLAPPIYTPEGTPCIKRVLIANRGEIACRIIDTCQKLGITSIGVYADVDEQSLHASRADESYFLGPADEQPYQNAALLIEAGRRLGVDAIHPGYGYLSENADFAMAVGSAGMLFVGPSAESIAALGNKSAAKALLHERSSVPLIPGYYGDDQDPLKLHVEADSIGYPVLIKASAGGGGKGMRIVYVREEFPEALTRCASEAQQSFGSSHCLVEKYIEAGKHVEIQIFGDGQTTISFLDRECSIQRRNQKVIEESPCHWMGAEMRRKMSDAALEIAGLLKYKSAGTVEFIVDVLSNKFYFLEVNTRIQVEHPITEEVIGVDLVALQFYVAGGGRLSSLPELQKIEQHGHAIEVRLCAEDPFNDFRPCIGTIHTFKTASEVLQSNMSGVRYELGVRSGSEISIHFDSMISKVIVWTQDRRSAIQQMIHVLKHTICLGVTTNQLFLLRVLSLLASQTLDYTTAFIAKNRDALFSPIDSGAVLGPMAISAVIFYRAVQKELAFSATSGFRSIPPRFRNQRKDKAATLVHHVNCELGFLGYAEAVSLIISYQSQCSYQVSQVPTETPATADERKIFFNQNGGGLVRRYYSALKSERTSKFNARVLSLSKDRRENSVDGELRLSVDDKAVNYFVALESRGLMVRVYVQCPDLGVIASYIVSNRLTWAGKFQERAGNGLDTDARKKYICPMPCKILQVLVDNGAQVKSGDGLLVMESMKTEVRLNAFAKGAVKMLVKEGDMVKEGSLLCEIQGADEEER